MYCHDLLINNCQILEGSGRKKNMKQKENPRPFNSEKDQTPAAS